MSTVTSHFAYTNSIWQSSIGAPLRIALRPFVRFFVCRRMPVSNSRTKNRISYTKCSVLEIGKLGGAQYRIDSWSVVPVKNVVDLGVTIDSRLKFSTHINGIAAKAHRRANLIIRCFMSRDLTSLIRAFTTYVRPVLEYCTVAWNPMLKKDIETLEKVQRRFTKRIPGLKDLTYCQRLLSTSSS